LTLTATEALQDTQERLHHLAQLRERLRTMDAAEHLLPPVPPFTGAPQGGVQSLEASSPGPTPWSNTHARRLEEKTPKGV
jgi:hypothetical protein